MKHKKYSIIYADPAWHFKSWSKRGEGRSVIKHYEVMSIEDIKELPVALIAADDAVLFLWITFPLLPQALDVIESWGFTYKTIGFAWVKRNIKSDGWFWGLGYYTRANCEICLLATKGRVLPRQSRSVHSIVDTPVETHSKKPDVVRERIVQLFGNLPRIELFARQQAKGWDSLGFEIDEKDIREAMQDLIAGSNKKSALRRAA